MSNYRYDPDQMKNLAAQINNCCRDFSEARNQICIIVRSLGTTWVDPVNQQFVNQYLNHADPKGQELEKMIKQYGSLLQECSVRYGTAIDSGNSFLKNF